MVFFKKWAQETNKLVLKGREEFVRNTEFSYKIYNNESSELLSVTDIAFISENEISNETQYVITNTKTWIR